MIAFAYYLLKVIMCSGILFLYYHVALRNKVFHQWNRFYLLAAVLLSIIAPIVQISIVHHFTEENNKAIQLLQVIQGNDYLDEIVISSHQSFSVDQWMMTIYAFVSLIFFTGMMISIFKIFSIIQSHTVQWLQNIRFVNTSLQGTPFSFFHFIFWNEKIDLQTETGLQIFQHELVHVKEKHTIDKLFMHFILVLFWCNPFFWFIRKELKIIHEFIADKKAVGQQGTAALAAMILNSTYPSQFNSLTNQFFQTSIKRRLAMLTKIQNPKINYFSRILALPIIALTVLAFTLRTKNTTASSVKLEKQMTVVIDAGHGQEEQKIALDTIPRKQQLNHVTVDIKSSSVNGKSKALNDALNLKLNSQRLPLYILDGKEVSKAEVDKIDPSAIEAINVLKDKSATIMYGKKGVKGVIEIKLKSNSQATPLFIADGKETTREEVFKIDPSAIESINVLKGKPATDKYGKKGENGVIEINLKKARSKDNITLQQNGKTIGVGTFDYNSSTNEFHGTITTVNQNSKDTSQQNHKLVNPIMHNQ